MRLLSGAYMATTTAVWAGEAEITFTSAKDSIHSWNKAPTMCREVFACAEEI